MIQTLIDDYTKQGGVLPYAILAHPGFGMENPDFGCICDRIPADVFVCTTTRVSGIVIIPLEAAKVFIHGSLFKEREPNA